MYKVNICGIPYTVEFAKDVLGGDTLHMGLHDAMQAKITINEDAVFDIQQETLCHEILHAIFVHIGRDDLSDDEQFVQMLSNAIHQSFTPRLREGK